MELYHIMNRGVDKRDIFIDNGDHVRFVHCLFEFNDAGSANNTTRHLNVNDFVSRSSGRERLVDIHGWCLVKNHYHLLLSERVDGGLTQFLRKVNIGFAKFFNEKYNRSGTLFQGRTKKVLIEDNSQFLYILHYVHLNALDLLEGARNWRVRDKDGIRNARIALEHLEKYRWSSYQDYIGKKNFPSIVTTRFFNEALGNYARAVSEYLHDAEAEGLTEVTLE